jgi:hypothetical protein
MKLAALLAGLWLAAAGSLPAQQRPPQPASPQPAQPAQRAQQGPPADEWKPLPLARLEPAPDSVVAAGLALTPAPGSMEVAVGFDNSCDGKTDATYQLKGAVVKIRVAGPVAGRPCPGGPRPEAYAAHLSGLKAKRYQVIVYLTDAKKKWQPWKAGVTQVQ